MKKTALIICLCFMAFNLFSQTGQQSSNSSSFGSELSGINSLNQSIIDNLIYNIDKNNRLNPAEYEKALLESIVGTPYMDNDFKEGEINMVNGKNFTNVMLRYNIYNDIMEAKANDKRYELSRDLVKSIIIDSKIFKYLPYQIGKKEGKGYLEMLNDGEIKLYCRYSKKFKEQEPQKAMENAPKPPEFKNWPKIYLLMKEGDNKATGIKNKKGLIGFFTGHHNEIQDFIKKHKIKHNKPGDLNKLIDYYSSLPPHDNQ